ncbi:hypothetical protein [Nocardia brevicatena]|uniref:hypothetical protein n=1 Tax=Nocardia brevicatena TaxID=37327 RepID=UPI00059318B4|nr:hypothetical protein [Nocardia brevicatena]
MHRGESQALPLAEARDRLDDPVTGSRAYESARPNAVNAIVLATPDMPMGRALRPVAERAPEGCHRTGAA